MFYPPREIDNDLRIVTSELYALQDYQRIAGKIIFPQWVTAYTEQDTTQDFFLNARIPFLVEENLLPSTILHWNNNWLDPYWDLQEIHKGKALQFIEKNTETPPKSLQSFWTHGFSYHVPPLGLGKPQEPDNNKILMLKPWWKRIFSKTKTINILPSNLLPPKMRNKLSSSNITHP